MTVTLRTVSEQDITQKIAQLSVPSRLGEKTSLEPVKNLLARLGSPEQAFPAIHVGGTSGKGSTATFLANILSEAGYRVGLFTKPHLASVRERFVINREPVSPAQMMALLGKMERGMDHKPTWFELTTALAFQYFADEQVDFGVIEVGLGGSLDATNVIQPVLSMLTNVGLDHTDVLGDTVEQIAADKAGIIKQGRPALSGVTQPIVREIIEQRARQMSAPLQLVERDFRSTNVLLGMEGGGFDFEAENLFLPGLSIQMPGKHQVSNATLAVAAAIRLRQEGFWIPTDAIRTGLAQTQVPGRMEIIQNSPAFVLDGAHSPPKMSAFAEGLRTLFSTKRRKIGILSFSKGHDASATLGFITPLLDCAILTEFSAETDYGNKRAHDHREVAALIKEINPAMQLVLEPDPVLAVAIAREMAGAEDLICVTGSIFLVGQIREYLSSVRGVNRVPNPSQTGLK